MNHLKRLHEYNKDRYPYLSRMLVGAIMWFELYFIVILNQGVTWETIRPVLGWREAIGAFTLFCFLWWLRIADDLKTSELKYGSDIFEVSIRYRDEEYRSVDRLSEAGGYILREDGGRYECYTILDSENDTEGCECYITWREFRITLYN